MVTEVIILYIRIRPFCVLVSTPFQVDIKRSLPLKLDNVSFRFATSLHCLRVYGTVSSVYW